MRKSDSNTAKIKKQPLKIPGWVAPLSLVIFALRVSFLLTKVGYTSYDEGIAAVGAKLVLHGKIPYRDFWTIYSPGTFYLNALGLAISGHQLIDIRITWLVLGMVQSLLVYLLARRVSNNAYALIIAAISYLALIPIGLPTNWLIPALACVYSLVRFLEKPTSGWLYACGLFSGLTVFFRQDAGIYLIVATLVTLYLTGRVSGRNPFSDIARTGASMLAVCAAEITYFAINGALPAMIKDTLYFPLFVFPHSRPLPYPIPWNEILVVSKYTAPVSIAGFYQLYAFYILPAVLVGIGVFSLVRYFKRSNIDGYKIPLALCVVSLVLFLMVSVRPSGARISASILMSLIAFSALVSDVNLILRRVAWFMLIAAAVAFVPFSGYTVYAQRANSTKLIYNSGGVYTGTGLAESISITCLKVKQMTSPSEKIYSGSPAVYFISERNPCTIYYEPHPCLTDTPDIQKQIINDIERNHVRLFVRSLEWDLNNGYFTIEPDHEPEILIDYIEKNYKIKLDYCLFQIYERNTPFRK